MAIVQFTRFKGGKPEEMIASAKKAKVFWEKNGAEWFRMSRFHTGAMAGEWLISVRFPDWLAYGKAHEALSKDHEYQQILAGVMGKAELTGRNVAVGIDL